MQERTNALGKAKKMREARPGRCAFKVRADARGKALRIR
jgi:hypothetical protein